jgi:FAD/FMN-containing dehydrogenase
MNCTLGGMIGNNSCGARAQRTGKVVGNVAALEVLLHDGTRFWCGPTGDEEYARIGRRGDRRVEIYRRLRRAPGLPLNLVDGTGVRGRALAVLP